MSKIYKNKYKMIKISLQDQSEKTKIQRFTISVHYQVV